MRAGLVHRRVCRPGAAAGCGDPAGCPAGHQQSPLKAALLAEKLGADIDIGFDDSTLQPTLELVLRGATAETARKFAAGVRKAVDDLLAGASPRSCCWPA